MYLQHLLLTVNTIHTSGINWESVTAIASVVVIVQAAFVWLISRKDKKREEIQEQTKQEIADSVNHLSEVLLAKLETKDTVSAINARLASVEGMLKVNANRP